PRYSPRATRITHDSLATPRTLRITRYSLLTTHYSPRAPSLLQFEPQRSYMPGVADLSVIEGSNAHKCARCDGGVVRTADRQAPPRLERPASGMPARRAAHIGAIAGEFARQDHARNDGAFRNQPIELGRIRHRLVLGHVPARVLALAMLGIEIDEPERGR